MSETKPPIHAFCAAGCKWETVHKEDFDEINITYIDMTYNPDTYNLTYDYDLNKITLDNYKNFIIRLTVQNQNNDSDSFETQEIYLLKNVSVINQDAGDTTKMLFVYYSSIYGVSISKNKDGTGTPSASCSEFMTPMASYAEQADFAEQATNADNATKLNDNEITRNMLTSYTNGPLTIETKPYFVIHMEGLYIFTCIRLDKHTVNGSNTGDSSFDVFIKKSILVDIRDITEYRSYELEAGNSNTFLLYAPEERTISFNGNYYTYPAHSLILYGNSTFCEDYSCELKMIIEY